MDFEILQWLFVAVIVIIGVVGVAYLISAGLGWLVSGLMALTSIH